MRLICVHTSQDLIVGFAAQNLGQVRLGQMGTLEVTRWLVSLLKTEMQSQSRLKIVIVMLIKRMNYME